MIYEIRAKKVILDSDLARVLKLKNGTRELNQYIKRHSINFNEEDYFQLNSDEFSNLMSQFVISKSKYGGVRKHPFAFTRNGIEVLHNIIKSNSSKEICLEIIKAIDYLEMLPNALKIEDLIYEVRGKQVMLDSDLALLYQCKNGAKSINQAIKRHEKRFPEDFYFQLTKAEYLNLKSQLGTSSLKEYGGIRKMPFVFTEQGVAMLATILRTSVAEEVSVI